MTFQKASRSQALILFAFGATLFQPTALQPTGLQPTSPQPAHSQAATTTNVKGAKTGLAPAPNLEATNAKVENPSGEAKGSLLGIGALKAKIDDLSQRRANNLEQALNAVDEGTLSGGATAEGTDANPSRGLATVTKPGVESHFTGGSEAIIESKTIVIDQTTVVDPSAEERIQQMLIPDHVKAQIISNYRRTGVLPAFTAAPARTKNPQRQPSNAH